MTILKVFFQFYIISVVISLPFLFVIVANGYAKARIKFRECIDVSFAKRLIAEITIILSFMPVINILVIIGILCDFSAAERAMTKGWVDALVRKGYSLAE